MLGEIDIGTLVAISATLLGAWWAMAKLMFSQFEKRQDERFTGLQNSITGQKTELDEHMRKQDDVMAELRRIEISGANELRRIETEYARSQLLNHQTFQTKTESSIQHGEILTALRSISARIDQINAGAGAVPRGQ